ncbi:hypothetical protein DIPPA_05108 [Diplonema papillatum]|nr:hypothetical protein DIPPA_05097 [Diplonema papillatum]KAJ9461687.1 hypothetical protein DIPPA_05099 [Diplonema papillatum]KAJ9461689.1 hypothetical protein DIPPA_05108 [Diplonema papillatum]
MLRGIVALALAASLVHGETYSTVWNLYRLEFQLTGHGTQDDFVFKAEGIHLEGSNPSRDYVDATIPCNANQKCEKQLSLGNPWEEDRTTLPRVLYLPIQVWEDDCGSGSWSYYNSCNSFLNKNSDDLFFDYRSDPRELALETHILSAKKVQLREYSWSGTDGQAFKAYFSYQWSPSYAGPGCLRLWERAEAQGSGRYETVCSGKVAWLVGASSWFFGPQMVEVNHAYAAVVSSNGSVVFWVPHDVSDYSMYNLPSNIGGAVTVEFYDMYLAPRYYVSRASVSEEYVGLVVDGACQSLPANEWIEVHVRPLPEDGDSNVFLCVFDGADCTGRRRCWQWDAKNMHTMNAAWGMSQGVHSARLVRVASPAEMTFALVDPALDSGSLFADSVWSRPTQLLPDLKVSCRRTTQRLDSTATADVFVSGSNSMCPLGCFGFQKGGAYVAYDEVAGTLTTTTVASRRVLFKPHSNTVMGIVVLQLLLDSYDAQPLFLVVDPVTNELALTSKPTGDCAYFWTDTTPISNPGDSMLDTLAREYEEKMDEGSDKLAAFGSSGRLAEATLLASAFCAYGADAPLCRVLDLADTAAEVARYKGSSKGTYTDLTVVQFADLEEYLKAVSQQYAAEDATNQLLDAIGDVNANLLDTKVAICNNMNELADSWADSRVQVAQVSKDLTAADAAYSFQLTRNAREELAGILKNDIQPRLDDLGTAAKVQGVAELAGAFSNMFSLPPAVGAAIEMADAAAGMAAAVMLSAAAKKAAGALGEVADGIAQAVTNLETLQARNTAINIAYEDSSQNDQDPDVQQAYTDFVQAYNDFNGGDVVSAIAGFDYLGAIIDALCDLAGNLGSTTCTELANYMSLAAGRAEEGITNAYDAAGRMGAYAELQVELNSLSTFKAHVAVLQDQASEGVAAFFDVLAVTRASYKVQRLTRALVVHKFATMFCAMQRYNYMGYVNTMCEDTLTGTELVTHVGEVTEVTSNAPGPTRQEKSLVAGLPVTNSTRLSVSGSVNLVKLMQGEPVAVRLPRDSAWRQTYGWHRAKATSFVKSLKVMVPVLDAAGSVAELWLSAHFSVRQPLYNSSDKLVRHNLLKTPSAVHQVAYSRACNEANPYAYGDCADLIPLCLNSAGTFGYSEFAYLPSLDAEFQLTLTHVIGLNNFSRIPEGGMVLRVEAVVVEVGSVPGKASSPSSSLRSSDQGCCNASQHVVDWQVPACTPCPEGTSSASSMGIYCQ